ncbi:MAG: 3-methyl-2-oxobutanoate dehydrogenase subunit VorB [Ruminococcaceae bacterium]|nr:3-methyl-2-oxobutanoate dehydrogenase subunit VorB [Oscillospiraceae bacterium]
MSKKVLMKGNEAIAEAAIASGCVHFFGYPITPQTEIAEYMAKRLPKVGGVCLQAESEVAAVNMLMGAVSTGTRAMTSSSSPGISLKSEGISYIAGCDLPCLVVNVQRGGPGLGGIQPSQQDYYQATRGVGHGDLRLIVVAPSSVQEMASLTAEALDLADTYRMPAMLLADGALGQMMEPVAFSAFPKRDLPEKSWATNGHGFKRKKNITNSLYIDPNVLEQTIIDRYAKYAEIEKNEVKYEEYMTDDADIVIVAFGITARICKSAVAEARRAGIKAGLLRPITLWPFPKAAISEVADHAKVLLSVEMSMGQMVDDVRLAVNGKRPVHFFGRTGGVIPSVEEVTAQIKALAENL